MTGLVNTDYWRDSLKKHNEWFTPSCYIEAAREVFGGVIDLDPASCELANQTVKAKRYYAESEDGLVQEWSGNVWLNPPFVGMQLRKVWTRRLLEDYRNGHVEQAILLMPTGLDAQWFQPLWEYPICFPSSRIYFYEKMVHRGNPNFCACFTYLGTNEQKFVDVFSQFGTVVKRVSSPSQKNVQVPRLWEVAV